MKKMILVILAVCMVLCACSNAPAEQTTDAASNTTTENVTTEQTTDVTEETDNTEETPAPETTEATVPVVLFRNPLNGEPIGEPITARPYAIVINNIEYAQPMCSISQADILFEVLAEGGITRCLAIYDDVAGIDHIGAIRSARPYLVELASSFYAFFVHHGGSVDGYNKIYELDFAHLDFLGNAGNVYYRDQDRLNSGYALEHTSFADGDDLKAAVDDWGYRTNREDGIDYGFVFGDAGSTEAGESATEMSVVFGAYGKTTKFNYDETTGLYASVQYGDDIVDGNTDDVVSYRNVLMLTTDTYVYENNDGARVHMELTGEGSGYFACDGKVVPIRWSRDGNYEPFVFTHEDGTPITLGVGRSYIAITPLSGSLEY